MVIDNFMKYTCANKVFDTNYFFQVVVINPKTKSLTKLNGTNIGEFFGASLAVGDINNDGLDDLLIGAPYCREDNGRVYVYFGTFEVRYTLHGKYYYAVLHNIVLDEYFYRNDLKWLIY